MILVPGVTARTERLIAFLTFIGEVLLNGLVAPSWYARAWPGLREFAKYSEPIAPTRRTLGTPGPWFASIFRAEVC
jgi:hypothetical protein